MLSDTDQRFMQLALEQAQLAALAGEVPVGAVVVQDDAVIGVGRNAPIGSHDPTAHAEIVALRAAAQRIGNYRLEGCTLYVTLEPCAMCASAVLQARLKRLVYGASEPKTGAAGSVLNLFSIPALNHHTQLQGGVLDVESRDLLQNFFNSRRLVQREHRESAWPLRDDALRTPEHRFSTLDDYPWSGCYVNDLPALEGLRLHYLDLGSEQAQRVFLCVHGLGAWSYQWRALTDAIQSVGARLIAPDLPGFGKSDKPKRADWHVGVRGARGRAIEILLQLSERLDLQSVVLISAAWDSDWTQQLALALAGRVHAVLEPNFTLRRLPDAALQAPFPDNGHQAATRTGDATAFNVYEPGDALLDSVFALCGQNRQHRQL